jgi:hypothetical protein
MYHLCPNPTGPLKRYRILLTVIPLRALAPSFEGDVAWRIYLLQDIMQPLSETRLSIMEYHSSGSTIVMDSFPSSQRAPCSVSTLPTSIIGPMLSHHKWLAHLHMLHLGNLQHRTGLTLLLHFWISVPQIRYEHPFLPATKN